MNFKLNNGGNQQNKLEYYTNLFLNNEMAENKN